MTTIEERAHAAENEWLVSDEVTRYGYEQGYIKGATEQQKIDTKKFIDWLKQNWKNYVELETMVKFADFESDLRNAMEEEQ